LLSGEPGIGKSRLFLLADHQDSALHPFIAQLERAAGFAHDDTPEQKLGTLAALIAPGARDHDEVTLIADLLSLLPSSAAELELTPQRKREKLLAALLHQLEALARQQPFQQRGTLALDALRAQAAQSPWGVASNDRILDEPRLRSMEEMYLPD
jgi:hypothetical protein